MDQKRLLAEKEFEIKELTDKLKNLQADNQPKPTTIVIEISSNSDIKLILPESKI
jgi:hypothetical protein